MKYTPSKTIRPIRSKDVEHFPPASTVDGPGITESSGVEVGRSSSQATLPSIAGLLSGLGALEGSAVLFQTMVLFTSQLRMRVCLNEALDTDT